MRRLILEVLGKELSKAGIDLPTFHKIKTSEILYFLRQNDEELAAVSRVEFKDTTTQIQDLTAGDLLMDAQLIEKEKNGAYIIFTRIRAPGLPSILNAIGVKDGYLLPPLSIQDGKIKFSFLGNESHIKDFMEKITQLGIHYRVILLADANFSPISPLNQLTSKQQNVLLAAYKHGYYDIPRKITTEELAKKLGLVNSTVVEHLRKAENRLIKDIIENKTQ